MYKIISKTPLLIYTGIDENGSFVFAASELLQSLDGLNYQPDEYPMSDYIETDGYEIQQIGPSISLKYDQELKSIVAISSFSTDKELTSVQIENFMEEYDGQMTDGFGSGMTQNLSDEYEAEFEVYSIFSEQKPHQSSFTQQRMPT